LVGHGHEEVLLVVTDNIQGQVRLD
jgi:hypothetical protein